MKKHRARGYKIVSNKPKSVYDDWVKQNLYSKVNKCKYIFFLEQITLTMNIK